MKGLEPPTDPPYEDGVLPIELHRQKNLSEAVGMDPIAGVLDRFTFRVAHTLRVAGSIAYVSTTKFPRVAPEFEEARKLVLALKMGDTGAARECAKIMSKHPLLMGFRGLVTPAPRSTPDRVAHLYLAKLLVAHGIGDEALPVVRRIAPVPSSRILRQKGLEGVPYEEHVRTMEADPSVVSEYTPILVIDDVFTAGNTLRSSATVIRKAGYLGEILGATAGYNLEAATGDPYRPKVFTV